ncbi:ACRC.2 family protein [Megaselia abdita]
MDYKFEFFNSVDPTKVKCRIREKFAKLCLSSGSKSKKENRPEFDRENLEGVRKSLDYLLTDDESDKENNQICDRLSSLNINKKEILTNKERRRTSFYSAGEESPEKEKLIDLENSESSESVIEVEEETEEEESDGESIVVLSSEDEEEFLVLPSTTEETKANQLKSFLEDVVEQIKVASPYDDTVSMHESFVLPVEPTFHPKDPTPQKINEKHALMDTVSFIESRIFEPTICESLREERRSTRSEITIAETTSSSFCELSNKSTMKRVASHRSTSSSSTEVISTTVNFKIKVGGAISATARFDSSEEECSSQSSKRLKSSDGSISGRMNSIRLSNTNTEVIKTLRQSGGKRQVPEESMLGEFSIFHRAIPHELESTRLTDDFKLPAPRTSQTQKSSSQKASTSSRVQKKDPSKKVFDDSSDDEYEIIRRRPQRKASTRKPILEDTIIEQEAKPTRESDTAFNNRLKQLFDKSKNEYEINTPTPSKTKRKLWTPTSLVNQNDKNLQVNSPKPYMSSDEELLIGDDQKVTFNGNPLGFPALLKNKKIESVKTGKPIFKLPTPKKESSTKKERKLTQKKDTKCGSSSEKSSQKNATAKSPSKTTTVTKNIATKPVEKAAKKNLPQTPKSTRPVIEKIADTPKEKYSFLKSLEDSVPPSLCHPDALIYKENFKDMKEELTKKLYELYNEKCFKNKLDVPITWNKKLTNTAGRCANKRRGGTRLCAIDLSDKVLSTTDRLRCTLIHELCHAATWIFEEEHGHGATWKAWAHKANTIFPELPKIDICHQYEIEYKYTYRCTKCKAKADAHSKSKKVENIRCAKCHGKIEILHNKKDKDGNVNPTPVKEAKGFAKFVKEKYKYYKQPEMKHADVMKVLGGVFSDMSINEKNKYNS